MVDDTYRPVATIDAGNGFHADLHDMQITPQNTAIVMAYVPVARDLTAFGGPANGSVLDLVVQEIDPSDRLPCCSSGTASTIFRSARALSRLPADNTQPPWDYVHGNALEHRHRRQHLAFRPAHVGVYKINRDNGRTDVDARPRRRLHTVVPGVRLVRVPARRRRRTPTARSPSSTTAAARCFRPPRSYSRGLVLSVNETNHTASKVSEDRTTTRTSTPRSQGAVPTTAGRSHFIGLGRGQASNTEFDSRATDCSTWSLASGWLRTAR